jgi:hypothetical protein
MTMEPFVRWFIRASLVWLGVGVVLGFAMVFWPNPALHFRPAHAHANLLGFVSMMIFGVAYHVIPRFTGNPLASRRLAFVHLYAANAGLALLVGGWLVRPTSFGAGTLALQGGAVLGTLGVACFIFNLWRTLDAPAARPAGLAMGRPAPRAAPGH